MRAKAKAFIKKVYQNDWTSMVLVTSAIMITDNLLSYHFKRNIINDLFTPCSTTLMLIQFMFGIVNMIGFASFYIQIELILPNGLDPAHLKINKWQKHYPIDKNKRFYQRWSDWYDRIHYKLSIFWFGSSEKFIRFINLCGIFNGFLMSYLALINIPIGGAVIAAICHLLNGIFYLSLIQVSGDFLGLQSDANLVETNFVMFVCTSLNARYPVICIMILRWLAFRTMLACGLCKWNGSRMWKNLTAMVHHYYTQPLPNPISYYVHNCPRWYHELEVFMTLFIEGPLPFLAFGPSWARYIAFIGFEAINLLINTTGNYGFIGALNMTENASFLDDSAMFKRFNNYNYNQRNITVSMHWEWWEWLLIPPIVSIMFVYVCASYIPLCGTSKKYELPFQSNALEEMYAKLHKYRLINYYAKFGAMHEGRYEFVLEGSNDCETWKKYEFLFKPSTSTQIPAIVPLHVPRLDWRTWFLPLRWKRYRNYSYSGYTAPNWWYKLEEKLKMNEKEILKLIKYNPFPMNGPQYIRTYVHKFDFTEWDERYDDDRGSDGKRIWWVTQAQNPLHEDNGYEE